VPLLSWAAATVAAFCCEECDRVAEFELRELNPEVDEEPEVHCFHHERPVTMRLVG
jgi:hypothetical protein